MVLLVLFGLAVPAAGQTPSSPLPRDESLVVTTGEGLLQAVPDRAFVSISAESRAENPREAQRRNAELMKPVQDKLRATDIPADAIRTTMYDLRFEFDWANGKRVPRGYVARNTIEIRVDNLEKLSDVLDTSIAAGATSVGDVRFDVKDRLKLEREALRLAVADAKGRADAAAAGAGSSVGRIVRIEEQGVINSPPMPMVRAMASGAAKEAETPIATGQIEIRARVTLTVALK
jgi:uncharacterized protein YggE